MASKQETSRTFDRKRPYASCEGDSRARYLQDGRYFTAAGEEISAEEAVKPASGGTFDNAVEAAVRKRLEPSEAELNQTIKLDDPSNPQNQPKPSLLARLMGTTREPDETPPTAGADNGEEAKKEASPSPDVLNNGKDAPDEATQESKPDPRYATLKAMHLNELNRIVVKAGGEPFRATLAKSRAINWLLENTAA